MIGALARLAAPVAWRDDDRTAEKLEEFAATEAGSALDMLKAAELDDDPALRRLFFRHALDEARHARRFAEMARRIRPRTVERSELVAMHARRHDLWATLGRTRFLAFVHLAESRGAAHFDALARHFADRPELAALFEEIAAEERFHVRYPLRQLVRREGSRHRRVLHVARLESLRDAWLRHGRVLGGALSVALMMVLYVLVTPVFAGLLRALERERPGWKTPEDLTLSRRQF